MSLAPNVRIETFLETFRQAYPGQDAPHVTYMDGWFRIKEKGEHEGKMRAEDLEERRRELTSIIESREFDLESIGGIAAASDQAHRAAKSYLEKFLQHRIDACTTIDEVRVLKNEVGQQCENNQGFLVPMPAEIDMAFFMKVSDMKGRQSA